MESLGEAFDALVRTTKIAIDHHLEKVETKITDTVERKTDNFDTKIRQIESERYILRFQLQYWFNIQNIY